MWIVLQPDVSSLVSQPGSQQRINLHILLSTCEKQDFSDLFSYIKDEETTNIYSILVVSRYMVSNHLKTCSYLPLESWSAEGGNRYPRLWLHESWSLSSTHLNN